MTHVTVHQLTARNSEKVFLNVDNDVYGCVSVWGSCYQRRTFLIQKDCDFYLMQFENDEYYKEWQESESGKFWKDARITEILPIIKDDYYTMK